MTASYKSDVCTHSSVSFAVGDDHYKSLLVVVVTDGSEPAKLTVPGAGNMPLGNRFQQLCGYVTQEDTFSPNLTGIYYSLP